MIIYEFYYYLCTLLSSFNYKIYFRNVQIRAYNFNFFKNFNNVEIIEGDNTERKNLGLADIIFYMDCHQPSYH